MEIEKRLEAIEKRLAILENGRELSDKPETLELDLILPEADIKGLHFNEQKVRTVFEKHNDGWWYSRDILFLSARNTEDDNSRDILTKYLEWDVNMGSGAHTLREQIAKHFGVAVKDVEIALPTENKGVKQYHGVDWWYWLADKPASSAANFCLCHTNGISTNYSASAVGGVAPAFCVA